jgi:eukaryotic-like serine/threonine-protein kinase
MPILTSEERIGTYVAGRYRLDSILGVGGMGTVFAGTHTWTDRRVAVKILAPEYARNETIVHRFLQEARTAASLQHPSVVDVLDMGEDADGTVFLVLELLQGEPLTGLIEREGPLDPSRTLELLIPIMRALVAAHRRGIVHRDIKPDNIFISRGEGGSEVPKILDFGIAKVLEGANSATATGSVIGTPYYMSPEQAAGASDVGPSSDVWSMGVVLYECLSKDLPFDGPNPTAVLLAIATGKAAPLGTIAPGVPKPLTVAIDRALEHDRKVRYATMSELIDGLVSAAQLCGVPVRARGSGRVSVTPAEPSSRTQIHDPGAPTMNADAVPLGKAAGPPGGPSSYSDLPSVLQGLRRLLADRRRAVWVGAGGAAVLVVLLWLALGGGGAADGTDVTPEAPAEVAAAPAADEGAAEAAQAAEVAEEPADVEPEAEDAADVAEGKELAPWEDEAEKARAEAERQEGERRLAEERRKRAARRRAADRPKATTTKKSSSGGGLMREW